MSLKILIAALLLFPNLARADPVPMRTIRLKIGTDLTFRNYLTYFSKEVGEGNTTIPSYVDNYLLPRVNKRWKEFGIRFERDPEMIEWLDDAPKNGFALTKRVKSSPDGLVLALTTKEEKDSGCTQRMRTGEAPFLGQHIWITSRGGARPDQIPEIVMHEVGHIFGAPHSKDKKSIMFPSFDHRRKKLNSKYDAHSKRMITLFRTFDFSRPLSQLSPETLTRAQKIVQDAGIPIQENVAVIAPLLRIGILLDQGRVDEAILDLENPAYEAINRLSAINLFWAYALLKKRDQGKALDFVARFEESQQWQGDPDLLFTLSALSCGCEESEKASDYLKKALEIAPTCEKALKFKDEIELHRCPLAFERADSAD